MHETEIDADPCGEEVPIQAIVKTGFPELKENPFGYRICQVFSTCTSKDQTGNPDKMTFEVPTIKYKFYIFLLHYTFSTLILLLISLQDFVDMASVFSERAPIQVKADWAFRIFGTK